MDYRFHGLSVSHHYRRVDKDERFLWSEDWVGEKGIIRGLDDFMQLYATLVDFRAGAAEDKVNFGDFAVL